MVALASAGLFWKRSAKHMEKEGRRGHDRQQREQAEVLWEKKVTKNEAKTNQRRSEQMRTASRPWCSGPTRGLPLVVPGCCMTKKIIFPTTLLGKLLAPATDERRTQRHWEILRPLYPKHRWKRSSSSPHCWAAVAPPGTSAGKGTSELAAFGTADSGSGFLIKTPGLNPAQAPAWEESSSRQDPERSDSAGNFTPSLQGMGWICHQNNPTVLQLAYGTNMNDPAPWIN